LNNATGEQHGRGEIRTLDTLSRIHAFQASCRKLLRVTQKCLFCTPKNGLFREASGVALTVRDGALPQNGAPRNTAHHLVEHAAVVKSRVHRAIAAFSHSPKNLEGAYTARTHAPLGRFLGGAA
jgi:hypothetical protein